MRGTSQRIDSYKKLRFWQMSREVSLGIVRLVKVLPNERAVWIITDQVLRSSFSVGANIAEGFGRYSRYKGKEYPRFIQISLGSARETEYWLELLRDIHPKHASTIGNILLKNTDVIKMLTATLKSLRNKN